MEAYRKEKWKRKKIKKEDFVRKRKWKIKGNWKRVKGETFGNKKMTEGRWRERELDKKKGGKNKKDIWDGIF